MPNKTLIGFKKTLPILVVSPLIGKYIFRKPLAAL